MGFVCVVGSAERKREWLVGDCERCGRREMSRVEVEDESFGGEIARDMEGGE